MKLNKGNTLSVLVLAVILVLAFFYIKDHGDILNNIKNIKIHYIFALILLSAITVFIGGLKIKVVTELFGIRLKVMESFGLSAITIMGNYLTPFKGGASARAVYMKKKYSLPYTSFVSALGATHLTNFFLYGLIGIVLFLFFFRSNMGIFFSLLLIIIPIALMFLSLKLPKTRYKSINYFINAANEWRLIRKSPKIIAMLTFLEVLNIIIFCMRFYVAFISLSSVISFQSAIVYSLISILSSIFAVTPGGIGVREGLVAAFSKISGTGFSIGAYAASVDRAVVMLVVLISGLISSFYLLKKNDISR